MIILIIASSSLHPLLLTEQAACKWTDSSAVVVDIENERFTVMCLRCRQNFKFENFTMSFGRLRLRIVLKCVPHVQHDHFCSSTNQIIVFWRRLCRWPSSLLKLKSVPRSTNQILNLWRCYRGWHRRCAGQIERGKNSGFQSFRYQVRETGAYTTTSLRGKTIRKSRASEKYISVLICHILWT